MQLSQCLNAFGSTAGALSGFLVMGLLGGFTHCSAMCGPFVLAQVDDTAEGGILRRLSKASLLPYHMGRATTYILLAVLFSAALNLAFLFLPIRLFVVVPMLLLAGAVFLVNAFPDLSTVFPWVTNIRLPVPFQALSKAVGSLMAAEGALKKYLLGVLLGFMPCGMLVAALMAAASLESPLKSGIAMFFFAVGTLPGLFVVAAGGHAVRTLYPETFARVRQVFLGLSALWLFALAGLTVL